MSPANIESTLKAASPLIGSAVVIGDRRPYNVALIVPDPDAAAGVRRVGEGRDRRGGRDRERAPLQGRADQAPHRARRGVAARRRRAHADHEAQAQADRREVRRRDRGAAMAKPLWRQAFDEVDKRVSGPVEAGAHSDLFGDLVTLQIKLARRAQREVERRTRRVLHVVNLPTATDVRRLSEQVAVAAARAARARGPAAVSPSLAPADLLSRVERDVQRALRRSRNGLRYAAGTSRPKVGRTPKDVVWRRHKAELWRYRNDERPLPAAGGDRPQPRQPQLRARPLPRQQRGRVPAPVEGLDVFLLDWGVPDEADAGNTLETYVDDGIPAAVAAACEAAGTEDVNAARLLLRRRAQPAVRRPPPRAADPQPRADGHAGGLHARWRRSPRSCATAGSTRRTSSSRPATSRPT